MKYVALCELALTHAFYRDGQCPDFAIAPSAETARLLGNHRCLWRTSASGIRVLAAQDPSSGQLFLPLAQAAVLRFHLTLQNPDFARFTELSEVTALPIPLYQNSGLPAGQGGDLRLTAGSGSALPSGVFAAVELTLAGYGSGPVAPQFRVAFAAKAVRWAYYCITDLSISGDELSIADTDPGAAAALLFSASNRTKLDEQADPTDPIAVQCLVRHPGMRCVRLISDEAVVCREEPRKYLELRRGANRLTGTLANPSLRSVVSLGAPHPAQDLLFQILEYRTRPAP